MAGANKFQRVFTNTPTNTNFTSGEKSKGILDDFAVRKNVATKEGTIEKVPVNNSDIVNKLYADSLSFLKLDCSNDPLIPDTSNFQINFPSAPTGNYSGIGIILRDPTDADGTATYRISPALILSSQGKGATNQTYQWAMYNTPSSSTDNTTMRFTYKFGAGAWTLHPFYLDTANGFVVLGLANAEDIYKAPNTFNLLNTTAATSTVDQYSPPISWASQGWKTAATAATQYMGLIQVNAPEKGTISPIGVHKWIYGINTFGGSISTETDELMRLQWGSDAGVTGVFFNKKSLADFTIGIDNLTGATGTFTTVDLKTVTVTKGIITSIV